MKKLRLGDVFYKEEYDEICVLDVNDLIDPPHDCGLFELSSSECRYTSSTEKSFNNMGWIKLGNLNE